jgi:uncharacterized membrane protein
MSLPAQDRETRPSVTSVVLVALSAAMAIVVLVLLIADGRLSVGVVLVGVAIIGLGLGEIGWMVRRGLRGPGAGGWVFVALLVLVLCWVLVAAPQQLGGPS